MNYNVLKESIAAVIKANGNEEITGDLLQQVLLSMVNILGSGYQFMGAAVPTTNPGTPDARVFYIATQAGTYANFGSPAIVLDGTQIAVLLFASSWTSVVLSVPTKEYVDTALALKVDKVEGKGLSTNDLTDALVALIGGAFQKEDIAQDLGDSTTKVVSQAAITAVLLQYAKVDGYYAQLTAGAAENLVGRGSVPATFLRRTTGGTADVGTGTAKIAKLMGNSIVWNQLVGSETTSVTIPSGHKYASFIMTGEGDEAALVKSVGTSDGTPIGVDPETDNVFDLTKMFTAGHEPSTIAEFTALFPLDNYAYNAGEVLPFAAEKLVTTGFNQWDEEWELGKISASNGQDLPINSAIRTKGYIPIFPNTAYYVRSSSVLSCYRRFYDADKNYLGESTIIETNTNAEFTTPVGAYYMRFYMAESYGTTYKNDICINLSWSGYRNGEYEPYEKHELVVDPANWEDANGDKIFPYGGMHGVGTARDFATPDNDGFIRKGTRVFGRVDLGSVNWVYDDNNNFFYAAGIIGAKARCQGICSRYQYHQITSSLASNLGNKEVCIYEAGVVYAKDTNAGTDAAAFKAAMNGVYLYHELTTPVETELAEPVAASYYANDFGTEEWQPANTDEPYTAPCEMAIAYAMNAVDTLRRLPENYISVGSFENFCTELATKLGAALNKTITITPTYDSEDAEYDYAITIADIEG